MDLLLPILTLGRSQLLITSPYTLLPIQFACTRDSSEYAKQNKALSPFIYSLFSIVSFLGTLGKCNDTTVPIPVAARSKAWVCGRSLAGIVGSNPAGDMDVCVVFVVRTVAWNVKWHEGRKGFKTVQKWITGQKPRTKKKNPAGGKYVCLLWVLCVVR
jgi:hypothetical protein